MPPFSDYVVYVDESGDHGLSRIDSQYPIFVLSFCCFRIAEYTRDVVPAVQEFKFRYFGHDQVILHENEIRKQEGEFAFLRTDRVLREQFLDELTTLISDASFDIITSIVDKRQLKAVYRDPHNPYHLGLRFGLERLVQWLRLRGNGSRRVFVIFEMRGGDEDRVLELEFRRITSNSVLGYQKVDFSEVDLIPMFVHKRSNSTGLQLADLTARPIGLHYLRPEQANRAYDAIRGKIRYDKRFP